MSPDRAREALAALTDCRRAHAAIERLADRLFDATEVVEVEILARQLRQEEVRARVGLAAIARMLELDNPLSVVLTDRGAASGPGLRAAPRIDEEKPAARELAGEVGHAR